MSGMLTCLENFLGVSFGYTPDQLYSATKISIQKTCGDFPVYII